MGHGLGDFGWPGKELDEKGAGEQREKAAGAWGRAFQAFSSNQPTSRSSQAMRALDWKDKGTGGRRASDAGCVIGADGGP